MEFVTFWKVFLKSREILSLILRRVRLCFSIPLSMGRFLYFLFLFLFLGMLFIGLWLSSEEWLFVVMGFMPSSLIDFCESSSTKGVRRSRLIM